MITIYPNPSSANTGDGPRFLHLLRETLGLNITPFSCGRAALLYGLRAMGLERTDEILVPPFLGHCVLSSISKTAFPTMIHSNRTKAILVYHQFGYPQDIEHIETVASQNRWTIVNDCANTIFSSCQERILAKWGDFSVLSFAKLYPCVLGGALISGRDEIQSVIELNHKALSARHLDRANMAHTVLDKAARGLLGAEAEFEIDAVFGYLPEVVAFPDGAFRSLPNTQEEIEQDAHRRRRLLAIVTSYFPKRVPECSRCEVIPFAIPIAGDSPQMQFLSERIRRQLDVEVPILNFDFARNMLDPDYRQALVVGCHAGWNEDLVTGICEIMRECMP